nr:MAG TPA: minor tail protein [Caudoviricetes sp.]
MNEQTLELQIKSKSQEVSSSLDKLVLKLTGIEKSVTNIDNKLKNNSLKSATTNINQLTEATDKATSSFNRLENALKTAFTFAGIKNITSSILSGLSASMEYSEALNLFNVVFKNIDKNGTTAFSNIGKEAINFQNRLNEAFGTNKEQTLTYQALYQSMAQNMGINDSKASIMSETSVKLINDLSSLYNKTEKTVATSLSSGIYSGQVQPLRKFGLDITEKSLQPVLDSLGIDRNVRELSQAEKQILRYITVVRQSSVAHADWASTIESPSNQLKIFGNQLNETKVAISSLFIGTFSQILPYANALLMVIKEVSKAIADMFGIELRDYNSGIASQEDAYIDFGDSVDGATKKVKELKRQVLGFDEIHNINENKDTNGSSGTTSGGIDQRLLDAITGYDNGMDKVRMKASQIRDDIMKWLGFTKEIDPLTGEVSFKYQGIKTTLKNMWNSFKGLSTQGKILVGLGLVVGATKLWNIGKKLVTVTGSSGLGGTVKSLLSPMKSLYNSIDNVNYANKSLTKGLAEGITNWSKSLTAMDKFKVGLVGMIGVMTSLDGIKKSMKSVADEGWNLGNSLGLVASEIGIVASSAYIGSAFGPLGTAIGGVTGALIGLHDVYMKMPTEVSKTNDALKKSHEELKSYLDTLEQQNQAIEDNLTKELTVTGVHKNLVTELENLIDANGKVKKGYEDRAEFIVTTLNNAYGLEIEIINGKLKNYDKEINKIREVIKKKEAEILLEANQEKYANALKEENTLWYNKEKAISKSNEAQINANKAQEEYNEAYENWASLTQNGTTINLGASMALKKKKKALEEANKTLKTAKDDEDKYTKQYIENQSTIIDWSNLNTAVINGNYQEIEKAIKQYTNTYQTESGNEQFSLSQRISKTKESLDLMLEKYKDHGEDVLNSIKSSYGAVQQETYNELMELTKTTEELTPDIVEAWGTLARTSKDDFLKYFNKLPKDVQQNVVDKMQEKGYSISTELQKGINKINPSIKIKADTSSAEATIKKLIKSVDNISIETSFGWLKKENGGVFSNGSWKNIPQYANGGVPSHGSMFVAGEHGAEIVGHINGKTEVLNQSQLASAIYSSMVSAMSQYGGGGVAEINVHADKGVIVETAVNGIQQHVNQTGTLPFTIPTY